MAHGVSSDSSEMYEQRGASFYVLHNIARILTDIELELHHLVPLHRDLLPGPLADHIFRRIPEPGAIDGIGG